MFSCIATIPHHDSLFFVSGYYETFTNAKMLFSVFVFIFGPLVTFGRANVDAIYQRSHVMIAVSYAGIEPNSCNDCSFIVLTGQDDIHPNNCLLITNGWIAVEDFVVLAIDWVISTGDTDYFYSYFKSFITK